MIMMMTGMVMITTNINTAVITDHSNSFLLTVT